jgi:hypothetical protein
MKKILATLTVAVVVAGSALGQGQVTMANNASSLITYLGSPVAIGSSFFQLTYSSTTGLPDGTLTPIGSVAGTSTVIAGRIANTTTAANSLTPGASYTFQILGWQGASYTTYAQAAAAGAPVGFSTQFLSATSANASPPPTAVSLAGLYAGFALVPIPEPATMALAGLGAAALLIFRRRK